jgi:hypothetical protein
MADRERLLAVLSWKTLLGLVLLLCNADESLTVQSATSPSQTGLELKLPSKKFSCNWAREAGPSRSNRAMMP